MDMNLILANARKYGFNEVNLSKGEFQHNLICGDCSALGKRPEL